MFTKNQKVKIIAGKHAGREAFFNAENRHRPGRAFVYFAGVNMYGAQVNLTDLAPA